MQGCYRISQVLACLPAIHRASSHAHWITVSPLLQGAFWRNIVVHSVVVPLGPTILQLCCGDFEVYFVFEYSSITRSMPFRMRTAIEISVRSEITFNATSLLRSM